MPETRAIDATLAGTGARAWTRGEVGVLLFLAGEVMLFAGLLAAAIVLRADDPRWGSGADELSLGAGAVGTALLAGASIALARSSRGACALAALLGAAFLALQAFEYRELLARGLSWRSGVFGSCFYVLTAIHALHVLGGVAWVAHIGFHGPRDAASVRTASWYWHLVDGVWVALFLFFYLA